MASRTLGMVAGGLALAVLLGAARPATQPGGGMAGDILHLGDADPAVRDSAQDRLWRAGSAAEPMLRSASASDNPERAERARALLQDIEEGITPATSPDVVALLRRYQFGSQPDKNNVIQQLGQTSQQPGQAGLDGTRVLLQLDRIEKEAELHQAIDIVLQRSRFAAPILLLAHDSRLEPTLLARAKQTTDGQRDYSAYLLESGELPAARAALRKHHSTDQLWLLALLENTAGDPADAARDSDEAGNYFQENRYLKDAADWAGLSRLADAHPSVANINMMTTKMLAAHFAGERVAADKAIDELLHIDAQVPPDAFAVNRQPFDLCMVDHSAEAIDKLLERAQYSSALQLLDARMDYGKALAQLPRMAKDDSNSLSCRAQLAQILQLVGKPREARETLQSAARASESTDDRGAWEAICKAARFINVESIADHLVQHALEGSAQEQQVVPVLMAAGDRQDSVANAWRRFLADSSDPLVAIRDARAIAEGRCPRDRLRALGPAMEAWTRSQPPSDQPELLDALAMSLDTVGERAAAADIRQRRAQDFPTVEAWTAVGNAQSGLKNWPAAIDAYRKAADIDPTAALPVFLLGYATAQSGDTHAGREQMDFAHLLALGDLDSRSAILDAAHDRRLDADADREQAAIVALADVDDVHLLNLLQKIAEQDAKSGDYRAAAQRMRQLMAAIVEPGAIFINSASYLVVAARAHGYQGLAELAAHHPAAALAEAKTAFADWPGDVDDMIALIRASDQFGDKAWADSLFAQVLPFYTALSDRYPASAAFHNEVAWFESRSHRRLDEALAQARRAVDLDPHNAGILDTLAETHYQRREFQAAIDTMVKCIELQPDEVHHRKQLLRFRLGLLSGVIDKD